MTFNSSVLTIPIEPIVLDYSTTTLKAYAVQTAKEHHLKVDRFVATIECESHFVYDKVSHTKDFGVVQINAYWHPEITKEQMYDPYWSIDWMADEWEEKGVKGAHQWVCYQNLYE